MCKQFDIDILKVNIWFWGFAFILQRELLKYMLESDVDKDGILDFQKFKVAIKVSQVKRGQRRTKSLVQKIKYLGVKIH